MMDAKAHANGMEYLTTIVQDFISKHEKSVQMALIDKVQAILGDVAGYVRSLEDKLAITEQNLNDARSQATAAGQGASDESPQA